MAYPEFTPKELQIEQWRDVTGFENYYKVSDLGRIMRIKTSTSNTTAIGKILKPLRMHDGRFRVDLRGPKGVKARPYIHQIVMIAFVGPYPEGKQINHLDGRPINNRLSNLEYCTMEENTAHAVRMGLKAHGTRNGQSKLTDSQIPVIRQMIADGFNDVQIARNFPVCSRAIWSIRHGRAWVRVQ